MTAASYYIVSQSGRWRYVVEYRHPIRMPRFDEDDPPQPLLSMTTEIGRARTERGVRHVIARHKRGIERRAHWQSKTRQVDA